MAKHFIKDVKVDLYIEIKAKNGEVYGANEELIKFMYRVKDDFTEFIKMVYSSGFSINVKDTINIHQYEFTVEELNWSIYGDDDDNNPTLTFYMLTNCENFISPI